MLEQFRVLIVEDDPHLLQTLADQLSDWKFDVGRAQNLAEARSKLHEPWTFLLLDLHLPDGSGLELARELAVRVERPMTLAVTGTATAQEAFELATLGVRAYLPKPIHVPDLRETLRVLLNETGQNDAAIETLVRARVGTNSYHDITSLVRRAIVDQALRLAKGNKSGAARLLHVSRQAVQQLIRSLELGEDDVPE